MLGRYIALHGTPKKKGKRGKPFFAAGQMLQATQAPRNRKKEEGRKKKKRGTSIVTRPKGGKEGKRGEDENAKVPDWVFKKKYRVTFLCLLLVGAAVGMCDV